jgi:transcriptional antiterminator NusG
MTKRNSRAKQIEKVKVDEEVVIAPKKEKFQGHLVITQSEDPRAKWYVVHSHSGYEVKVSQTLKQRVETMGQADKVFEVLIPTQETVQIRGGKKLNVTEKIFPGYLLIKMILDDNSWLIVRTTPGITGFVGVGNTPTPISQSEVTAIQKFMSMDAPKFKTKFSVGEAVKIVDGPFSEFLGSIEEIDEERGTLRVLVSIFGRETPVELDFLQVAKI